MRKSSAVPRHSRSVVVLAIVSAMLVFASLMQEPVRAATAPAFVQGNTARISSGGSVSASFGGANTAGNLIVAYVIWSNTSTASVSDSRSNVFSSVASPTQWSGGSSAQVFYAKNVSGGSNTVTATFASSVSAYGLLYIHEYSGLDQANPLETTTARSGASGSLDSGFLNTTNASDLLFAAGASTMSVTSAPSGYAMRSGEYGNLTADQDVTATGSYNATASQNGTAWVMQQVAFRAAGSSAPAQTSTPTQTPTLNRTATPTPTNSPTPTQTPVATPIRAVAATPGFVQVNTARISSGGSVSAGFAGANTTGNLIVAYIIWSNTSAVSLADSRGDVYTSAASATPWNGGSSAQVFYARNISGGANTVTATFASAVSGYGLLYIHEYSGLDQTNPLETTTARSGALGSLDSGFLNTTNASDLLFVAGASTMSVTSAPSGYAMRSGEYGNLTADQDVTATGSYNATASQNGTAWVMQQVAFRAAGSSAPAQTATPTQTAPPTQAATPTHTATPTGPVVYPLKPSANHRYLVDQAGAPFLVVGDSPQSLIGNLSLSDADYYFANRQADGFNAVWINLVCNSYTFCNADGSTFDGIAPFTTAGDLSTPNDVYFSKVDQVLRLAANHGLVVFLDPLETGGWLDVARNNGTVKTNNYGKYVGNRYKNFPNIVWLFGNDFQSWRTTSDDALIEALAQGIKSTDANYLGTTELDYLRSASLDDGSWGTLLDLDGAYTYYPTFDEVLHEYNRAGMPVFMEEANYEFEHNFTDQGTPQILRRQEYWTLLSGGAGQFYGNLYTVRFLNGWKSNLDTPGARQLGYVTNLFAPRTWYNLVPDQAHTVVTAGYGTYDGSTTLANSDYATAARTPDGNLVIAYMPTLRTLTVDMTKLSGPATARWYDPASGTYTLIGTSLPNTGSQQFTPPGNNADGNGDWVLVIETG